MATDIFLADDSTKETVPVSWNQLETITLPDWESSVGMQTGMLSRLNSAKLR